MPNKAWVLLVLLASWIRLPEGQDIREGYQIIEFFAGKRRVARLAHAVGLSAAAHDITYDSSFKPRKKKYKKSCMDINDSAGFLFPGLKLLVPKIRRDG